MNKDTMNRIIEKLNELAKDHDQYEYGLPIMDDGQMALMREAIQEIVMEEDSPSDYFRKIFNSSIICEFKDVPAEELDGIVQVIAMNNIILVEYVPKKWVSESTMMEYND